MTEDTTNVLMALKILNISFENLQNHMEKLSTIFDEVTLIKKEIDTCTSKTMRVVYLKDHVNDLARRAHNRFKECDKSFAEINTLYQTKHSTFSLDNERLKDAEDIVGSAKSLIEKSKKILDDIIFMETQIQHKIVVLPVIIDTKLV